jgi:hypothetical protein
MSDATINMKWKG